MNKLTKILLIIFFIIFLFTSSLFGVETTTIDRMLIRKSNVTVQGSRLDRILNDEMRPPLIGSSVLVRPILSRRLGYRPVITVLPSGTNLSVNILISDDRRYVRIGVSPMFSSIGRVETFMYTR